MLCVRMGDMQGACAHIKRWGMKGVCVCGGRGGGGEGTDKCNEEREGAARQGGNAWVRERFYFTRNMKRRGEIKRGSRESQLCVVGYLW